MYSRSHLLIQRDYEKLQDLKLWGIEASPLKDDNLYEWTVKILGLRETPWEGGVFRLYLKYDENYNRRPPEVCFHTIPFHPNVDMITGKPCVDFLNDWSLWKESYGMSSLLLTIQSMLSNPVLEGAVNTEAVNMIITSPHLYRQMVDDCVAASQRVEAGIAVASKPQKETHTVIVQRPPPQPSTASRSKKAANISFEDYHITWSGIATSKSNPETKNPLLESLKDNVALQSAHYGLPIEELHAQMEKQLQEQSQLVYGKFRDNSKKVNEDELKEAKLEKINQMRKIYLQSRSSPRRTPITLTNPTRENTFAEGEPWENEVDDLVAWTNKLDEEAL